MKRRAAIVEIVRNSPDVCGIGDDGRAFGVRELTRRLEAEGIKTTPQTVSKDIRALAQSGDLPPG